MITFRELGNYGRLGNQLFQYAILKSVSLKTGYRITLPTDTFEKVWHGQKCLLNNFKLPSCSFSDEQISYNYAEKYPRHYDDEIYKISPNTNLHGFFQNPKYYIDIQDEIRKEFEFKDDIKKVVDDYLSKFDSPTVSLHLRRGDACDGTNPVDSNWVNDFSENSLINRYYTTALKQIPKNSKILLFTGGSRFGDNKSDIEWCKEKFNDDRIFFVDGLSDIESFAVMSSCDYNITSFASTYSWWASFLNRNQNIIAPKIYYPTMQNIKSEDVYPNKWNLI